MTRPRTHGGYLAAGGAVALLVGGGFPAGVAPASARPTDVPPGDPAAPKMPSAADLAKVRGVEAVDRLRRTLLDQMPDSYAGTYEKDGRTVILTTGALSAMQARVESNRAAMLDAEGTSRVVFPELTYATARHTRRSLMDLRDRIVADLDTLGADGVQGAGIDDVHNAVVVIVERPVAGLGDRLAATYGTDALRVMAAGKLELADRPNDVAPWNAGNELVAENSSNHCTSGFGMHRADTGETFGTTAGHCDDHVWFNTKIQSPDFGSSRLVGKTLVNHLHDQQVDVQAISGSTSRLFWQGGVRNAVRQYVAGAVSPEVGTPVCTEGAVSGEVCGTVILVDFSGEVAGDPVNFLFFVTGACDHGDSGGPMVRPSGFGYFANGTLTAGGVIHATSVCVGTDIGAESFSLGLVVNSLTE